MLCGMRVGANPFTMSHRGLAVFAVPLQAMPAAWFGTRFRAYSTCLSKHDYPRSPCDHFLAALHSQMPKELC